MHLDWILFENKIVKFKINQIAVMFSIKTHFSQKFYAHRLKLQQLSHNTKPCFCLSNYIWITDFSDLR